MQAIDRGAPRLIDFLGADVARALRRRCARCSTPPGSRTASTRAWCAASTTTTCTVFEWVTDQLGAQGTVCGGGRYDGLFEQLGGKPTPAVGWGMGIERMLLLLEAVGVADAGRGARRLRRSCPAPRRCRARCRPARRCAPPACRCRCTPPAATAGQHEVAVQEGRRQRRALRADLRRRRAGARRGVAEAAARRRRAAAHRCALADVAALGRRPSPHNPRFARCSSLERSDSPWPPISTSKSRNSSTS